MLFLHREYVGTTLSLYPYTSGRCVHCSVEFSVVRGAQGCYVYPELRSNCFAMLDFRLAEHDELVIRPGLITTRPQATQEQIDRRSQDDEAPASKAAKDGFGQTLMFVGSSAKNQMPIEQKSLATVKDAGDRAGQRNLVFVDLSDLPCRGPGGVAPLFANQLARCRIAKPEAVRSAAVAVDRAVLSSET